MHWPISAGVHRDLTGKERILLVIRQASLCCWTRIQGHRCDSYGYSSKCTLQQHPRVDLWNRRSLRQYTASIRTPICSDGQPGSSVNRTDVALVPPDQPWSR